MEQRDADFTTMSGVPVEPVYGPADAERPGSYPYTRGPYASMYRSKLWTMRMFAGFGTAIDTNRRFHELLAAGSDGLSTAYDLPTLLGRDSDDPLALGEVGKCGVAVDTLADVEDLYAGIDLGAVTTSMTINGPAAVVLAMYVAAAQRTGVERAPLGGSGRAGCGSTTARRTTARCGCGSTRRPRACRSPRSSPRSTSCAPRSRRSRASSAARRACTRTRWTRRSRSPPRRRPGSR